MLGYTSNKMLPEYKQYKKLCNFVKTAIKKVEVGKFEGYSNALVKALINLIEARDKLQ